ncbi:MAG: hypothetical protein Q7U54_13170 [Bacteroidales bacterium]|nr:hypothetical protein [Bacteroidales bacterium]
MQMLIGLWLFYRKLLVPSITMSVLIGLSGLIVSDSVSTASIGTAYIVFAPFFHFVVYEIRNPNEYYFYHNLGLSKMCLWMFTIIFSFFIGVILIAL